MVLGTTTVGRKTPLDGKLEIAPAIAERLRLSGEVRSMRLTSTELSADGVRSEIALSSMECTCAKAATGGVHTHYFLESPLFRKLGPGSLVALEESESGDVVVRVGDNV